MFVSSMHVFLLKGRSDKSSVLNKEMLVVQVFWNQRDRSSLIVILQLFDLLLDYYWGPFLGCFAYIW